MIRFLHTYSEKIKGLTPMYPYILTIILILILLYSTATDIRKREIPIELFLFIVIPIGFVAQILQVGPGLLETISVAGIVGITYTILALFFKGGTGDIIMMVALSLCLGKRMILIIGIATLLLACWRVYLKLKGRDNVEVPYVPVVLIGFLIERVCLIFFAY